jgi:hypothetical protein
MSLPRSRLSRLLRELKVRGVLRAAVAWGVGGWVAVEVTATAMQLLDLPRWLGSLVIGIYLLGFPLVLGLAWAYDLTAGGLQRTASRPTAPASPPGDVARPTQPGRRRRLQVTAAVVLLVAALGVAARAVRQPPALDADPGTSWSVAVFPFRVQADASVAYLSEGMLDLLVPAFDGAGPWTTVDPVLVMREIARAGGDVRALARDSLVAIAHRLGADHLLIGSIIGTSARLTVQAELQHVPSGDARATATVTGSDDDLVVLASRLAVSLISIEAGEEAARLPTLLATEREAVLSYLTGRSKLRAGDFPGAFDEFARALSFDSTFALAALGLRDAATMTTTLDASRGVRLAWLARDRLGPRDRVLVHALAGPGYPGPSTSAESLDAWRRAVDVLPDRADVWYEYADMLLHAGAWTRHPDWRRLAIENFDRALAIDSLHSRTIAHRGSLALTDGDLRMVDILAGRLEPDTDAAQLLMWQRHIARQREDGSSDTRVDFGAFKLLALSYLLADASHVPDAARAGIAAAREMAARPLAGRERAVALRDAHRFLVAAGRPAEAAALLPELRTLMDVAAFAGEVVPAALVAGGDRQAALDAVHALEAALARQGADSAAVAELCLLAVWYVNEVESGGDAAAADRAVARFADAARRTAAEAGHSGAVCGALLNVLRPRPDGADRRSRVEALEHLVAPGPPGPAWLRFIANLTLAKEWQLLEEPALALAASRARTVVGPHSMFTATALLNEARIARRAGDTAAARTAYLHYRAFRADPEPAAAEKARAARAELEG